MADGQQFETGPHPGRRPRHPLRLFPGGLHADLPFCHTGTQRLVRNLDAVGDRRQVMHARDQLGEWPAPKEGRMLTNIVMMGMGEPLYNYDNVAKALKIVMDGEGIAISKRRITLSTSGVVPDDAALRRGTERQSGGQSCTPSPTSCATGSCR